MDFQILEDIGLNKTQARAYQALLQRGGSTAPTIAAVIGESRSNTYKLLDKICALGLATKDTVAGKTTYFPASPAALEEFVQKQSAQVQQRERKLGAAMPGLLDYFFAHSEGPSIRYFNGREKVQHIFGDMLKTGQPIYLLRSPGDVQFYDETFFETFRKKRAKLGIKTYALTPDIPSAVHSPDADAKNLFFRSWLPASAYTAPVEWNIYGHKVALISYGQEAMGIVIESAQIAESFRQAFALLQAVASSKLS